MDKINIVSSQTVLEMPSFSIDIDTRSKVFLATGRRAGSGRRRSARIDDNVVSVNESRQKSTAQDRTRHR